MILPAAVAKLNKYIGDPAYDRVINEISAANQDGLEYYQLDVNSLSSSIKEDLIVALEIQGYNVDYDQESEVIDVSHLE